MRADGQLPDPRAAQIIRLKDNSARLRERLREREQQLAELTDFKMLALSRLHAQHTEIIGLRSALAQQQNLRRLPAPPDQL